MSAFVLSLVGSCVMSARAAGPFDGAWYLDAERSVPIDVFQLRREANGAWRYFDGSWEETLVLDGQVHRAGSTASETRAFQPDARTLVVADGVHGREYAKTTLTLSADGTTLTRELERRGWDGRERQDVKTYARATPGDSFAGTWRALPAVAPVPSAKKFTGQAQEVKPAGTARWVIWTDTDGTMTWFIPATGETLRGKANGRRQAIQGPGHDGEMFCWKEQREPNRLLFTVYVDGKPVEYADESVSADGQTYTDVLWVPGHEDAKQTYVYTRKPRS